MICLDMRPLLTFNDVSHLIGRDVKLRGQLGDGRSLLCLVTKAKNVVRGHLRMAILLASLRQFWMLSQMVGIPASMLGGCSALRVHISQVVRVGAWEQVIGSHARRVVATMAGVVSRWEWPIRQFIREPMCQLWSIPDSKLSVSPLIRRGRPWPARPEFRTVGRDGPVLVHLFPEPFGNVPRLVCRATGAAAESLFAQMRRSGEGLAALLTRQGDRMRFVVATCAAVLRLHLATVAHAEGCTTTRAVHFSTARGGLTGSAAEPAQTAPRWEHRKGLLAVFANLLWHTQLYVYPAYIRLKQ